MSAKLNARFIEIFSMAIIAFQKQKSVCLIGLFTIIIGKDSDDEVATEQLTAVV